MKYGDLLLHFLTHVLIKEKEYTTLVRLKESYILKRLNVGSITYAMTQKGYSIEEVQKTLKLLDDCIVVAHNAPFDFSFVKKQLGIEISDTLSLSRILREPQVSSHKLGDRCDAHESNWLTPSNE